MVKRFLSNKEYFHMKDYLKKLYEDYNEKYSELIEQMNREKATCRWGYGVMSAFSIDPYES